jgi:hypothetical protein
VKTVALLSMSAFREVFREWARVELPPGECGDALIYVAMSRPERTFKIGLSRDPRRRLRDLNSSGLWGRDLELLAVVADASLRIESTVVGALAFARSRQHRSHEVFRAEPLGELVALMRARAEASFVHEGANRAVKLCRLCREPGHNYQSCARKNNLASGSHRLKLRTQILRAN